MWNLVSCHSSCQYEPVKPPDFAFMAFKGASKLSKRFPKPFGSFHKPVKPRHSAFKAFKVALLGLKTLQTLPQAFGGIHKPVKIALCF